MEWEKQVTQKAQRVVTLLFCWQVGYYRIEASARDLKKRPKGLLGALSPPGPKGSKRRPTLSPTGPKGLPKNRFYGLHWVAFRACNETDHLKKTYAQVSHKIEK